MPPIHEQGPSLEDQPSNFNWNNAFAVIVTCGIIVLCVCMIALKNENNAILEKLYRQDTVLTRVKERNNAIGKQNSRILWQLQPEFGWDSTKKAKARIMSAKQPVIVEPE